MVKIVVLMLQPLKLGIGYGVSVLDKMVSNHAVCCALHWLTSRESPVTSVHISSDRTTQERTSMPLVEHLHRLYLFSAF